MGQTNNTMPKSTTPELSMTDFVDVVHQSGIPKSTKIRQVKQRPDYHPACDFYKPVREAIVDTHIAAGTKMHFTSLAGAVSDPKKVKSYPDVINGYVKWWGRKPLTWFTPSRGHYLSSGVSVIINPEVGLEWSGEKHIIKLYFKEDRIEKLRVSLILDLMEYSLRPNTDEDVVMSVLDVRASKLYSRPNGPLSSIPLVDAELAYIAALWPKI